MKRSTFAILLTLLVTLACAFASCNTGGMLPVPDGQGTGTGTISSSKDTENNYSSIIKELEEQILELKQDQYISESKRAQEIARLEALIMELEKNDTNNEGSSSPETRPDSTNTENENTQTDTEAKTDTETTPSPAGRFLYTVSDGKATITGFTGDDSTLTIPSSIDGYAVTCIADDAFESDTLQNVTIPDGVTKIGWFAFKKCTVLRTVTVPNSVKSIGYSAFPSNHKGFSIICHTDSFAASYAQSYGIPLTTI